MLAVLIALLMMMLAVVAVSYHGSLLFLGAVVLGLAATVPRTRNAQRPRTDITTLIRSPLRRGNDGGARAWLRRYCRIRCTP